MSKAECNRAYLNMKMANEATLVFPKVTKVAEIFTRKPYSSTNYSVYPGEKEKLRKLYKKRWYEAHRDEMRARNLANYYKAKEKKDEGR